MNNTIKITIGSPILRPGLEISTEVSSKYVDQALHELMDIAREYNKPEVSDKELSDFLKKTQRAKNNNEPLYKMHPSEKDAFEKMNDEFAEMEADILFRDHKSDNEKVIDLGSIEAFLAMDSEIEERDKHRSQEDIDNENHWPL